MIVTLLSLLSLYYKLYIYPYLSMINLHINYLCFRKWLHFDDVIKMNVILINIPWMFSKPVENNLFLNHVFAFLFSLLTATIFQIFKISRSTLYFKNFTDAHVIHWLTSVKVLRQTVENLPAVRQSGFCDLAMHSIIICAFFFDILYQRQP